jgi:predicted nucleic acid-binding protein
MSSPPSWLEVRSPTSPKADELDYLGAGEREAILLAEELRAEWLIIDDYEGRIEAIGVNFPSLAPCGCSTRPPSGN